MHETFKGLARTYLCLSSLFILQGSQVFLLSAVEIRINNSLLFDLNFVSKNTFDRVNMSRFHEGVQLSLLHCILKVMLVMRLRSRNPQAKHIFRKLVSVHLLFAVRKNSIFIFNPPDVVRLL